jgi:hypothetical protein
MPDPFPPIGLKTDSHDRNPAIRLFGRRLFVDQTVPEILLEFLLVAASPKRVGSQGEPLSSILVDMDVLRSWPNGHGLEYAPKARLNLKLFAFLGASKLDTRHETHRQHYRQLISNLSSPQHLSKGNLGADEILKTLENLFLGFQSVGSQRTWCAASFMPIAREVIADESIWRVTAARAGEVNGWESALPFFSHTQQLFLARSGALLFLQILNALRTDEDTIRHWADKAGLSLDQRESSPVHLHGAITSALDSVLDACPATVGQLAEFLDTGVDKDTAARTDLQSGSNLPRFASCGWCPEESWPEGLLFAVELLRLCEAAIDPIERLEMLEIACGMQVLRSLCAQSVRYAPNNLSLGNDIGALNYVWAFSDPSGSQTVTKQISRRNVNAVQRLIHNAVRNPGLHIGLNGLTGRELKRIADDMDKRYGYKLFLTIAKRIGLIVPKRGSGARFVLNDKILRFLVLSLVRPGERIRYDTFKKLLLAHYGIAVDDAGLAAACVWSGTSRLTTLGGNADEWLIEMLNAAGVMIRLSDSCSLVRNPFEGEEAAS